MNVNSKSVILMENLVNRLKLNKQDETFTLSGTITSDEYYTLTLALKALRKQDAEIDRKRGVL